MREDFMLEVGGLCAWADVAAQTSGGALKMCLVLFAGGITSILIHWTGKSICFVDFRNIAIGTGPIFFVAMFKIMLGCLPLDKDHRLMRLLSMK